MNKKVELLAPAGSFESLKAAVAAGADAIYLGGGMFGARAYADNFDQEKLIEAIDYAHIFGRKIYLTVNTLLKDQEMKELYLFLLPYYLRGLDGVIVQDMGVIRYIQKHFPQMEVHASTQMTITNELGARFLKSQGITRVVPSRELSLNEIKNIKACGIEVECFIHGALCYCYSGQCLLSSMIGGRSGNRGQCAQPCRLPYSVNGGKAGDYMSLKDLCTIDLIPQLLDAGIDSFKIEGRMKHPEYVYTVVSIYRKYIDLYYKKRNHYKVSDSDRNKLYQAFSRRGYTEGYYHQQNGKDMISFARPDKKAQEDSVRDYNLKTEISAYLYLGVGTQSVLSLTYGGINVVVCGKEAMIPERQPLDAERIEKQIKKTGGTLFAITDFGLEMPEPVFLPMQALNDLRRHGLDELSKAILAQYTREETEAPSPCEDRCIDPELCTGDEVDFEDHRKSERLSVSVFSSEQLRAAVRHDEVSRIYIDSAIALSDDVLTLIQNNRAEHKERLFFIAMPYIFRDLAIHHFGVKQQELMKLHYDGVLIRNWESYNWIKENQIDLPYIADYNLYTFNSEAKQYLKDLGFSALTAPVELNEKELKFLGIHDMIMIGYGYQPVMFTANCFKKTTNACDHYASVITLTDRYKKQFPVMSCCNYCYNMVLNSAPLYLADLPEKIHVMGAEELRLDFTIENYKDADMIIRSYVSCLKDGTGIKSPLKDYTRGHLKRGVR